MERREIESEEEHGTGHVIETAAVAGEAGAQSETGEGHRQGECS